MTYGGAVLGGALLAGCTDDAGAESEASGESADGNDGGTYSATMAPVGEVEFESVPEEVMVYSLLYADMAVAYGHGDAVNSLGFDAEAGGNTLDAYYEHLDGVSFDRENIAQLNTGAEGLTIDKEQVYELDSDLHLVDPALVASFDGWEREDVEEIAERVAAVFRAEERFEELNAVHDELLETIESGLPPEDERPTVGAVLFMDETFYPSHLDAPGFATADLRPLGAVDAFGDREVTYETAYDYETMLEIDPEIVLHRYGIASYYDVGAIRETLADHPVAGQLTAVEEGRVYPSGDPEQGPIMNLFQLEMAAKQLYPEQFGEWPADNDGDSYPGIPEDERLFDRERVTNAIEGDLEG